MWVTRSRLQTIQQVSPAEHDQHIRIVIKCTKKGIPSKKMSLKFIIKFRIPVVSSAEGNNSQALLIITINDDSPEGARVIARRH
jgi:hypothetical protein